MSTGKAYRLTPMPGIWDGMNGEKRLYRLDPPFRKKVYCDCSCELHPDTDQVGYIEHEYVVVSAADTSDRGPETLIFPAESDGTIKRMVELNGANFEMDHAKALRGMGYEVVRPMMVQVAR